MIPGRALVLLALAPVILALLTLVDELGALGVDKPIVPGVMPFVNAPALLRMARMNGTALPGWLTDRLDATDDPAEVRRATCGAGARLDFTFDRRHAGAQPARGDDHPDVRAADGGRVGGLDGGLAADALVGGAPGFPGAGHAASSARTDRPGWGDP